MKKLFLYFFITVALLPLTIYRAGASQLAGQDFTYTLIDSTAGIYHYQVTLTLYADCLDGLPAAIAEDNPAYMAVYSGAVQIQLDTAIYYSSRDTALEAAGVPFCREKFVFVQDFYLPASAGGYTIVYQRCCLNAEIIDITDPGDGGITAFCTIPPSGVTTHNNSAVFTNYPPFLIAINTPLSFDFSATDADGDSLSYELCTPYNETNPGSSKPIPTAPPYSTFDYTSPFSYSNPISCSAALAIDPVTGLLTGTPNELGTYLIAVCCHEWRGGVMINTVQREFEFTVVKADELAVANMPVGGILNLYPNPAQNELTISSPGLISNIAVSNLLGQVVYTNECNAEQVQVNVACLPSGVYFVKINGTEVRKFVKE